MNSVDLNIVDLLTDDEVKTTILSVGLSRRIDSIIENKLMIQKLFKE